MKVNLGTASFMMAAAIAVHFSAFAQDSNTTDLAILNYALTLEHLEYAFYRDGLELLSNDQNVTNATIQYLTDIRDHEKQHVDALNQTITSLGGTPAGECEYDFGYNTSEAFLTIARVLENVGTSAYIGAAYQIQDKTLLTVAATIATVEARHAAYLNYVNHVSPFPSAFDSPLDIQSVYSLAKGYIVNCSTSLGVEARPSIETESPIVYKGSTFNVTSDALPRDWTSLQNSSWCVFYMGSASTSSKLEWEESSPNATEYWCRVPESASLGDTYLFLSWNTTYNLTYLDPILAGPSIIYVEEEEEEA